MGVGHVCFTLVHCLQDQSGRGVQERCAQGPVQQRCQRSWGGLPRRDHGCAGASCGAVVTQDLPCACISAVGCCCDLIGSAEGSQPFAACQPQASTNLSWMADLLGSRDVLHAPVQWVFRRTPALPGQPSSAQLLFHPLVCRWLQVGMAADRDQYVHRVGRTARAGKQGEAVLILQDMERGFLRSLTDLPLQKLPAPDAPVSFLSLSGCGGASCPARSYAGVLACEACSWCTCGYRPALGRGN